MSAYYFAYGSNMNPARMAVRGMRYCHSQPATLFGWLLCFNKRAEGERAAAHANIMAQPDYQVEGVLYRLIDNQEITRMDPFEGYPECYRRECMPVATADGIVQTWVYRANPAWQAEQLRPERWYLNHLLSGRPWLSERYYRWLSQASCLERQ